MAAKAAGAVKDIDTVKGIDTVKTADTAENAETGAWCVQDVSMTRRTWQDEH